MILRLPQSSANTYGLEEKLCGESNAQYSPQLDITGNPDIVQTNTLLAIVSGLRYFNYRLMNPFGKYKSGVDLSNTSIKTIDAVTLRVNGGYIQKKERRKAVEKAIEALH